MSEPIRLNLGAGDEVIPGFLACDLFNEKADMKFDCAKIPFEDNHIDEIRAYHLIEHFDFMQIQEVLKEWYRALKPGGRLHLETPDFMGSCEEFIKGPEEWRIVLYGHFFAWPWIEGQCHKFLFTEQQLKFMLSSAGFKDIRRIEADSIYAKAKGPGGRENPKKLYLNVEAFK
jgi:predicted SAM-dependent methyltransferase